MRRILFAIPLVYGAPESFWWRESCLIIRALREMGCEAFLVALTAPSPPPDDPAHPTITCTRAELDDPAWWKAQRPDAIALNLWSATRYDAIRRAALQATPRVIERLDASGVRISRTWPAYFFTQVYGAGIDGGHTRIRAFLEAIARTVGFRYIPNLLERPMALTMARLPYVVAESPIAAARITRHIRRYSKEKGRVAQIPNPVYTPLMYYNGDEPKENAVISVGRWDSYQKDFPLLLAAAADFLGRYPDWKFHLVGGGTGRFLHLIDQLPNDVRPRVIVHGKVPPAEVARLNRQSKISYLASRWEGFCNASVESLCAGCSYVGPMNIAASSYLIENRSGTIANRRTLPDLSDALVAEAEAWLNGRRDGIAISQAWRAECGYEVVARRTLALWESIPA